MFLSVIGCFGIAGVLVIAVAAMQPDDEKEAACR